MRPQTRESPFIRHANAILVAVVLLACFGLDIAVTAAYHFWKHGTMHVVQGIWKVRIPSELFHHSLAPNVHVSSARWGPLRHDISTNSLGFKDKTMREVSLESSRPRIVFMGDSFTEGIGINYEKTFVGLVEATLAKDQIEVLNAAVASYSPLIYYRKTKHLLEDRGLQFTHMLVGLDISDIRDEAELYDFQDGSVIRHDDAFLKTEAWINTYTVGSRKLLAIGLYLWAWVTQDPEFTRTEDERRYGVQLRPSLWTIDRSLFAEFGEPGLKKARYHMDMLYDLLRQQGIGLTLLVYPWPDQILHKDSDSIQVRFWRNWADQHSVKLINLFPDFIHPEEDPKKIIRKYYIEGDSHWNEEGHQIVARRILKELRAIQE